MPNDNIRKEDLVFSGAIKPLADGRSFRLLISKLYQKEWVVYVKPPFKNTYNVLGYLSRYTHRIAISNQRIVKMDGGSVLFRWRDYSHGGRKKVMRLDAFEFIRRFLLHVLPSRYVKIRYYGILSHRRKNDSLQLVRSILNTAVPEDNSPPVNWKERLLLTHGFDVDKCPFCGMGRMVLVQTIFPTCCNGPPGREEK